jgi:hypothetical protein
VPAPSFSFFAPLVFPAQLPATRYSVSGVQLQLHPASTSLLAGLLLASAGCALCFLLFAFYFPFEMQCVGFGVQSPEQVIC